ncbi:MAG TPA: MFS transporter [Solirubrobacterales bacterium]|nr:MFS transporter [Solirubrobacterales bacterium]HMU27405.1 MFS transporter [Solirubrobacterales bacterium]HMX72059.1 MFS transporter [Solirubrobacterales bacterium]HNA24036.1 MFS transporter [Solirubrobacterales bacterium]HNA43837.1 MFS transporter [Solirubrobacterales bacterium]
MSESSPSPPIRVSIAVALLALSGAWNAGNVGPVASQLAADFDVSLAMVGLVGGTLFFAANVIGLAFAAQIGEKIGLVWGMRTACLMIAAGNLVVAFTPDFAGVALGRILPGLGFALTTTVGVVWARHEGGVKLVGIFGAAIQLGIAGSLLVGSLLYDQDVDWRVGFVISASLAALAMAFIPPYAKSPPTPERKSSGFLRLAVRRARVYRLSLLFLSIYGVPMILGAWMIEYLSSEGDVSKTIAGLASFLLFGLSAVMRFGGAELRAMGWTHKVLCGSLGLAAAGLAAIAIDPVAGAAFLAAVLLATGFGLPYATALDEAQDLYPEEPAEPLALMTLVALLLPIVVIPLVGHAISNDAGDIAFGALALFLVVATLANLKRSGIPLTR